MTPQDWAQITAPLWQQIAVAFVYAVFGVLGIVMTYVLGRAKHWLDARGAVDASKVLQDAHDRLQAAMDNAAGQIALEITAGKLGWSELDAIRAKAISAGEAIQRKLPDAIRIIRPEPDAISGGVLGKVGTLAPPPAPAPVVVNAAPPASLSSASSFAARAAIVVPRLMRDLGLTREQASGIVGNLGQESGLEPINEIRPTSGRGGFGWAQWTGPRRVAFETWCKAQGLLPTDPEANYGFLLEELRTTEAAALEAIKGASTIEDATRIFEQKFERAGVVAIERRQAFAQQAFAA